MREEKQMKISTRSFNLALCTILILNLVLVFCISPARAQYFTINRFHSDITIYPDSSILVKERIDVSFHRSRHGIYREIPFQYRDDFGKVMETPMKVFSVKDGSGKSWKYQVRKMGPLVNIRIGDENRYVSGNQTYVITYRVENGILFFDDHDELYWNVTGNEWKEPIREASANVTLATKNKSKDLWAAGYTGRYGSKESESVWETHENAGQFSAKRTLNSGEGLTIAFGWDKGLVAPPSSWKKFLWALHMKENWVFLLPILSLISMLLLWKKRGRDPKVRESIPVTYAPPQFDKQPLIPAEVGTLLDERLDPRDITSTIVGLAVKGYIRIEETKKEGFLSDKTDYSLKKVKDHGDQLTAFEVELMKSLFSESLPGTIVLVSGLKNKFYTHLKVLKKTLYGELKRKGYFLSNPESVRNQYAVGGIIILFIGVFVLAFLTPDSPGKSVFASILTGLPVIAIGRFMPAKTRAGASAYMDILGFQEFMNRAEKDRLERMGDKDLFSKFLPYAIALDVADNWAKAFEGIYQEPPDWYVSPGGFGSFHPYQFSHSIDSVTSNLSTAMFSAPRGSGTGGGGGGGGGSSGGGFGGGGGGSW